MNARILVVDDDPGIRSLVADFLARYGYQVEGAADAAAAERALARTAFEVAILDVMIPGEDGLNFCRPLAVIVDMGLSNLAAHREPARHRGHHEAVFQGHRPDAQRAEKNIGVAVHGAGPLQVKYVPMFCPGLPI